MNNTLEKIIKKKSQWLAEIKKNVSDETYSALIKSPDIFVKIINEIYVFVPFNGSNEKGGYFNVLNDGKTYDLYKM